MSEYTGVETPPSGRAQFATTARWLRVVAVVALGGLLLAALYLITSGSDFCQLAAVGLPGLTLVTFLSSATVFLPAPGIAAVGLAGTAWSPLLVALFAAAGSSAGELTGYLVGFGGRKMLGPRGERLWTVGEYFMRRWGFWTILLMAAIPNPAFDAVGMLAGSLRYSPKKLLVAIFLGNSAKYLVAALVGDAVVGEMHC